MKCLLSELPALIDSIGTALANGRVLLQNKGIVSEPYGDVTFQVEVIDDRHAGLNAIERTQTSVQPESRQVTTKAAEESVQITERDASVSTDTQTTDQSGCESSVQTYGRGSTTNVEYVS